MAIGKITAVAGAPGAGKTAWIAQQIEWQLEQLPDSGTGPLYCPLGGVGVPLDAVFLASQMRGLEVLPVAEFSSLVAALMAGRSLFVEVHNTVALESLDLLANLRLALSESAGSSLEIERVGIVPEGWHSGELEAWSDRLLPSPVSFPARAPSETPSESSQVWSLDLTGQVFDPPSLDLLWQELVGGAYGQVQRAKGLLCLADGSGFFFSFVSGSDGSKSPSRYTQLPLKPFLEGRPEYPSGLEVVGQALEAEQIFNTVQDCLLSDALLQQFQAYQAQETSPEEGSLDPEEEGAIASAPLNVA